MQAESLILNIKYVDITLKVGLDPVREGDNMSTFEISPAWITNTLFSKIFQDLEDFAWEYRTWSKHRNEEARAHFLSTYFNKIVALFSGVFFNTPEATLATKGRIEYQFKTYGGVTVVFIEVKLDVGNLAERLNCYAQVIAECDGMFRTTILVKILD